MTKMSKMFIVVSCVFFVLAIVSRIIFAIEIMNLPIKSSSFLIVANICLTLAVLFKK